MLPPSPPTSCACASPPRPPHRPPRPPHRPPRLATPLPASVSSMVPAIARSATWCAAAAACSDRTFRTSAATAGRRRSNRRCAIPAAAPAPRRRSRRTRRAACLSRRHRAPARRPTLRGIAKNESAFDLQLLAVDGKLHLLSKDQVAEMVREKVAHAEGRGHSGRDCATWSPTSAACTPIRIRQRRARYRRTRGRRAASPTIAHPEARLLAHL